MKEADAKKCLRCNEAKPATTEFFHPQSDNRNLLQNVCRQCRNRSTAAARAADPDRKAKQREYVRAWTARVGPQKSARRTRRPLTEEQRLAKRARQDVKLNAQNTSLRSRFRTMVKNVQKAVESGDKAKATELFKAAQPVIDSVADKGIFHKNKAARHKSRLAAKVKALATA